MSKQLELQREMRKRVLLLKDMGMSDRKLTKLIRSLDLPLKSHLDLLNVTENRKRSYK